MKNKPSPIAPSPRPDWHVEGDAYYMHSSSRASVMRDVTLNGGPWVWRTYPNADLYFGAAGQCEELAEAMDAATQWLLDKHQLDPSKIETALAQAKFEILQKEAAVDKARRALASAEVDLKTARHALESIEQEIAKAKQP